MLTIDQAKDILSLHERDGYLYEYRTVENIDYNRCRHTDSHTEEFFVHSATALISHLAEKAASRNDGQVHSQRAEAWKVVHEWVRHKENSFDI